MLTCHRVWRSFVVLLCLTIALNFLAPGAVRAGEQPGKKPNIIFMLIDDMGWTDLGCYGSKFYESPNIDKLAAKGMRFTNGYAACPVCSPTRASILTGKYPARLNLTNFIPGAKKGKLLPPDYLHNLPLDEFTLAEALRAAGYATALMGKWHLGGAGFGPKEQGFDVNFVGKDGPKDADTTEKLTDEALKFIEKNKAKPFYLHLCYYTVHIPLLAKKEIITKYEDKTAKLNLSAKFAPYADTKVRLVQDHPVYAAMIEQLDIGVGRIMAKLHELGIDKNTIVVFMSDNGGLCTAEGWPTSNLPLRAGKGWLYEGGVRVPWIIVWPGHAKAGSVCHDAVTSTDHYPSLLEMAGLKALPKQHVDGLSYVPLLKQTGKPPPDRALFWHYPHYSNQFGRPAGSVRKGDHVLIEFYEDGKLELYDLQKDLGQKHDLAKEMPQLTAQMHTQLMQWRKEVNAKMPTPNPEWKEKAK
jgi:arylsulfatase A-like enzyme